MSYCSLQCWWWSNVFRRPNSRCKINRQDLKAYGLSKTSYQPIKLVKLVGIGHSVSWWHVSATCHSVAFCRSQFQFSVSVPSIQQNKILFIRYHTSKSYGNKTGIISNTNHDDRRLTSKRDTERPAGCGGFTARCATAYRLAVNYLCFSRRRSLAVGSPASHGQPHYSKRRAQLAKTARHRYRAFRRALLRQSELFSTPATTTDAFMISSLVSSLDKLTQLRQFVTVLGVHQNPSPSGCRLRLWRLRKNGVVSSVGGCLLVTSAIGWSQ